MTNHLFRGGLDISENQIYSKLTYSFYFKIYEQQDQIIWTEQQKPSDFFVWLMESKVILINFLLGFS